jgi:hypothetical protein
MQRPARSACLSSLATRHCHYQTLMRGLPGAAECDGDARDRERMPSAVRVRTESEVLATACHPDTDEVVVGGRDGTLALLACPA